MSGVEQKVSVNDDGQYHQHDYVAKPDYHFEYGVEDPKTMVHQNRKETREGDVVHGEYRCGAFEYDKSVFFSLRIKTLKKGEKYFP